MTIREAGQQDLEAILPLFEAYRTFYGKAADNDAARQFLLDRIDRKESKIFLAEVDSHAVGFVQLYPLFSSTRMKRLWLLNDLYVNPGYRGRSISVALIERAKQLCYETNACGMFLETSVTNEIGNNLYPKTGFVLNQQSNYYEWSVS